MTSITSPIDRLDEDQSYVDSLPEPLELKTPADLFRGRSVPAFPLEALPEAFAIYAKEHSEQSGFDPGAYGFALLLSASNLINHKGRMTITDSWRVPAFQWGAVVDDSGAGKSPVLSASTSASDAIYERIEDESAKAYAQWKIIVDNLAKNETAPPKPAWRQRQAMNTTVEALSALLADNPEGVNLKVDEMTELLGRMDAYSSDGGMDRAAYLTAYNGDRLTINRKGTGANPPPPVVIERFSVGILTGIQPEKLAAMFKKSSGSADGLLQRFILYSFAPAGDVDFMAELGRNTDSNCHAIFNNITVHNDVQLNCTLRPEAKREFQEYVNFTRKLATRTAGARMREHINKYPGFLARLTHALHRIEAAAVGREPRPMVELETVLRAKAIMACLYRHSEAIYEVLDSTTGNVRDLVKSAAEAVLSKGWETFQRGDLTRNATHWQGADSREAENALDLLIEMSWIEDATPPRLPGQRGRRSDGRFNVHPGVHSLFSEQTQRIKHNREERFKAIQAIASSRERN
ncbi:MAG: YfjI family protein [Gammaproteobacteria bacterium]|nr:YfjI family protein [Gammaproteobacteria bacterium]